MAGRKKEPINVILEKGKKHLTKKEIKERQEQEIKAFSDKIAPPKKLPKRLHKEFNYYAEELQRLDILSNLDVETLANYVLVKEMYDTVTVEMSNNIDVLLDGKTINIQDKLSKQIITLSRELGLTVTSRMKLVVPKKEEEKKTDDFSLLFGSDMNG